MKRFLRNLLKGMGLGLAIATGLTAWVSFLRVQAGTMPFDRLQTTFPAVVAGYYAGGAVGGLLIGFAWPLTRWLLGYALLGMLGIFPMYLFAPGAKTGPLITPEHVASALLGAFFVGGGVGILTWADDHPQGPPWFDALRFPTLKTMGAVCAASVFIALVAITLIPKWSFYWPFEVILLAAGVLFIVPLLVAVLVTYQFIRNHQAR